MNRRERRAAERAKVSPVDGGADLVDVAADRGLEAIGGYLALRGHRVNHVAVFLHVDSVPLGQGDSVTAVQGFEDPGLAVAAMLRYVKEFADGHGIHMFDAIRTAGEQGMER